MLNSFRFFLLPILLITVSSVGRATTDSAAHVDPNAAEANSCPANHASYITWFPSEVTCPVRNTKNIFMVPDSYGSYIYSYPSKYQLIFWPYTDGAAWHSCKKCKFTVFMGHFETIPKDKLAAVQKVLEQASLPAQKTVTEKEAFERPPYLELAVAARLAVAEKVYQALDNKEEFWSHFYRVFGYHLDREGKSAEAAEARKKALTIVEAWLTDPAKQGQRKEMLYIGGAMRHFLQDDAAATKTFEEAAKLKYSNSELKAEQNDNYNTYLDTAIKEFVDLIKKGEVPKY